MNSPFFEKSKEIADNFIQNILFVDDQIYGKGERNHNLDIPQLLKTFEKAKKLCALSNPQTEEDFDNIIEVAKKADVIVLDWKIILELPKEDVADEEDVEEIDIRGAFTIKLIKHLLQEKQNEIKLIVIYTGEIELPGIVRSVLTACNDDLQDESANIIGKPNFRIVVAGKPTLKGRLNHTPELKDWIIEYSDIYNKILNEFTKMTEGLISNVALQALTSIRNNSFKLLNIYNKAVDPAFLAHRAMLPIVDEAGDILKESIVTSIKAILDYDEIENTCSYSHITKWVDQVNLSSKTFKINNKKELNITKKEIKHWQKEGFLKSFISIWSEQFPHDNLDITKLESIYKNNLHKEAITYFTPWGLDIGKIEEKFSMMTHHKSNFSSPSYIPKLSLGTIVKGNKTNKYWLCIQQKCDSVRIMEDEARRFLFLPLEQVEEGKKFNFLIMNGDVPIRLLVENATHNIRTIKFKSNKNGAVYARKYGKSNKYFFNPFYYKDHKEYNKKYDENFIWIFDLKDEHAQRIANIYSSKLSRVGLDESEWLRRWSGN